MTTQTNSTSQIESRLIGNILDADDDISSNFNNNPGDSGKHKYRNYLFGLQQDRPSSAPPTLFIKEQTVCFIIHLLNIFLQYKKNFQNIWCICNWKGFKSY